MTMLVNSRSVILLQVGFTLFSGFSLYRHQNLDLLVFDTSFGYRRSQKTHQYSILLYAQVVITLSKTVIWNAGTQRKNLHNEPP